MRRYFYILAPMLICSILSVTCGAKDLGVFGAVYEIAEKDTLKEIAERAKEEGFPLQTGSFTQAPFDTLGDFFRGTKGIMLDMYRRPDKLLAACEKITEMTLARPLPRPSPLGCGRAAGSGVAVPHRSPGRTCGG